MAIIAEHPSLLPETGAYSDAASAEPRPRRWTREEYYRLGDLGFFDDEHVELLDGEIWTLPPQKTPHFSAIRRAVLVLEDLLGKNLEFRQQAPMTLDDGTEPEPDILVVAGSWQDYLDYHPGPSQARLLVEVSDSTLFKDRTKKVGDYARAGIADYWIINLVHRQLEVYRQPVAFAESYGYKSQQMLLDEDHVSPLAFPEVRIAVADLLPPAQEETP